MSARITKQQLESYLWGAATLLRGTIDAGDYKQFIFPLLFCKRLCDVFDEETEAALKESGGDKDFAAYPENHRFQVPPRAHWRALRQVAKNVGHAIQSGMRAIETANSGKLFGIFGDAPWTNKDRLTDAMLRDLVEHFSSIDLTVANLPEDELGQGYEYLIKKFADDSGHTAAEFYTNRTVVHLMTEILEPQPAESIYDPTCGSGGMLLSCISHLRRQGKEWRNVHLSGQERNLMTSSIARMNLFLHGIEDFNIERGDTISEPKFVQGDRLQRFDVVLANPPYSIKQWDRDAFANDPWGRNLYGTPPQGRADYAFWQHILCSLKPKTGRCAILFPHGVLFRQEEAEMRRKLIEADTIDCVLGLGPNLFYNSPMEACIVICRTAKPKSRKGLILFINAVDEVTRASAQSFLTDDNVERVVKAHERFKDEPGFARVATLEDIRAKGGNLSIPLYVLCANNGINVKAKTESDLSDSLDHWLQSASTVGDSLAELLSKADRPERKSKRHSNPSLANLPLFDRKQWSSVRFGDVVENVNDVERAPVEGGIDRFIGLEHLEPGSLHVRSWGNVAEGTTFTRRCRPGQVLFGKRRAYQRKVALAQFDAVVSSDIYVLAPKGNRLLPELLPFLCLSERFFQHAVGTSAGSLSPRTNWSSLASFEFSLPPLGRQRRIAEMLWAVDDAMAASSTALTVLSKLKQVAMEEYTLYGEPVKLGGRKQRTYPMRQLGNVATTLQYGLSCPLSEHGNYPILRMMNYDEELIAATELKYADVPTEVAGEFKVMKGDILFNRTNSADLVGKVGIFNLNGCFLFASYLVRIQTDQSVLLPKFLNYYLNSRHGQTAVRAFATPGVSQSNISAGNLRKVEVPLAPIRDQEAIVEKLDEIASAYRTVRAHLVTERAMIQTLINAILGDQS